MVMDPPELDDDLVRDVTEILASLSTRGVRPTDRVAGVIGGLRGDAA